MLPLLMTASVMAFAQAQQNPDTIPKELVTLLLRGPGTYPGENFDITIGAPANFPSDLLPKGATAAVSTTSERGSTVVAEAPLLSTTDLLAYERDLIAAGWINQAPMSNRGLVASSIQSGMSVCKGNQYATIFHSPRPAGGIYLRISFTTDPRRGTCAAYPRPMSFFADVDLPQLLPPPGIGAMSSGSSSSSDSWEQRIRLEAKLSVDRIVRHYASQLENAGWKMEARADATDLAIVRLSSTSSTKETILAIVTATVMPGGAQTDLTLRLLRIDPNRRFPPGRVGGAGVDIRIGGLPTCCAP